MAATPTPHPHAASQGPAEGGSPTTSSPPAGGGGGLAQGLGALLACGSAHRGAAIGQVWTRHCRACPTAFIALSVHHMFVRPVALLVFQTVQDPCLPGWGQRCGPQVLGFTAWGHCTHEGRGVYVVFHVWVAVTMVVLACAGPSWPHTLGFVVPRVMEGSQCERSGVS